MIDSAKRTIYDLQYPSIKSRKANSTTSKAKTSSTNPSQFTSGHTNEGSSKPWQYDNTSKGGEDEEIKRLSKILQDLFQQQITLRREVFEVQRRLNKAKAAIQRLNDEDEKDVLPFSWLSYLFRGGQSVEEKEARSRRKSERSTGRLVQEKIVCILEVNLNNLNSTLSALSRRILVAQSEKGRQERAKQQRESAEKWAEELRQQAREAELRRRRAQKQMAEEERLRKVREENAREVREYAQKKAQKDKERWSRSRAQGADQEPGRRARTTDSKPAYAKENKQHSQKFRTGNYSPCRHRAWWSKVDGPHTCQCCKKAVKRFAFKCPLCPMIACASCRAALKDG